MANKINYLDRNFFLKPAGVPSKNKGESMKDCLVHEVSKEEGDQFVCKTGPMEYPLPPRQTQIYNGFFTAARECLQPEVDWNFADVLTREFQETVYDSYWKKPLGRVADQTPMLPEGMNPKEVCFGKPTEKGIPAGLLINPRKSYVDVMEESRVGHNMYKLTHNDYDPGEQIERSYVSPYKKNLIWGKTSPHDPNGTCIKKVLDSDPNEKILVSKILADHLIRTKPQLGKVFEPNKNINCVPLNHAFGKLNKRQIFGVGELLKDCDPNLEKMYLLEEFSYINLLRQQISKREFPLNHRDLNEAFHCVDENNTGYIDLHQAYKILADFNVFPDRSLFESFLKRLKFLKDDCNVAYEKMADLLNVNVEFPDVSKVVGCPRELLNFETTNQIAYKYHCAPENFKVNKIPSAGLESTKSSDSVESLVSPSIFTNFGVDPKQFFTSRSPEFLKTLFKSVVGCEMNDENFKTIWDIAQDKNGCVCVHSFWTALRKVAKNVKQNT